ncbi:DUF1566 domain-containing protein [Candidatus Accumulibacter sp. ACC003]|uniref:Lcl C-terminal domain-containing protein n=1 Tax=Candidatus Accumulibacter sp. ACC003 TaxID=2823334 RepID=UPI00344E6591
MPQRQNSQDFPRKSTSDTGTISHIPTIPSPTQAFGNFVDNGDGTVTDLRTGLMWTRFVLGQTWSGCQPFGTWRDHSWSEAVAIRHSFAGHDDWRLPTVDELYGIVEPNHSPPVNTLAFPSVMRFCCWTMSPHDGNPRNAWAVDFKTGERVSRDRRESHLIRLVRRGQSVTTSGLVETTPLLFRGQTELPTRTVMTERIDSVIAASIEKHGVPFALQGAARASTIGGEFFFRTVVLCGLECGLFRLPATETGSYL